MPALLLLLLLTPLAGFAEDTLFSSTYSGSHGRFTLTSTRALTNLADGSYQFSSSVKHRVGSINETSLFRLDDEQIVPLQYRYKRKILGIKKQESIDFDWENTVATYKQKGKSKKTAEHKLVAGIVDPSLYQLQLQRDAYLTKGNFNDGKVDYTIIRHKKIKNMVFAVVGEDELSVSGKTYSSLKLELNEDDGAKLTQVWLIPELHYHIGKIQHKDEDGDTYTIHLESVNFNPNVFGAIYPQILE